jgi:HlyD family secretion protein
LGQTTSDRGAVGPTTLVEISVELSGTVREVLADRNDTVRVGQPLVRLDTSRFDAQIAHSRAVLSARLARVAEATLREARDQHDRVVSLADRGVTVVQARKRAVVAVRRAEAMPAVATADGEVARPDLQLDETNLARACICSPVDGVAIGATRDDVMRAQGSGTHPRHVARDKSARPPVPAGRAGCSGPCEAALKPRVLRHAKAFMSSQSS